MHVARDVTLYILARVGLIALVTGGLLVAKVPLLVALAVGVVVALPASLFLFRGLRMRVAQGLAERAAERAQLRAQLRGDSLG
ncbi:hypothetical protein Lesp02_28730 [Lentzea sp. NBRC 105346]|uniref:DUF4229 domain-containing protein n=1 Tax=Lentzea sp. NBRC 105346 TaxID=3032205 RepID=UPI002554E21A|nr:DUF4229 domain-containing protein [Lentzea sp. NBRC 105346]GLZ30684.1 hypothetical protein Lesp02_28730 [Lentzea sp. NBRC 105346]